MASTSPTQSFRFASLPREIRDKVYRILLCSFGPRPSTVIPPIDAEDHPEFMNELAILDHDIDTSILLVSKQIHKEAYNTMVKTNRFVRVTSSGGFPIRLLLNHLRVPVVTENEWSVDEFRGYVLSVSLSWPKGTDVRFQNTPFSTEPCSLMMLKESISDFFSEITQRNLLEPFRKRLRGFKKVKVRGLVDRTLAQSVEEDVGQDTAPDPDVVVAKYQELKDQGQQLYRARNTEGASLTWLDAALEIDQLLQGSSWPALTHKGGVSFVARLEEMYFLIKINVAHIKLSDMEKGVPFANIMAEDALKTALAALRKDHWMLDFRWQPTDVHMAKFGFRYAVYFRLEGDPRNLDVAVRSIEQAHRLLPDDAGMLRERDLIMVWEASLR